MDFPEHLKLLQQLESLWGDGSEREEGRRERQKKGGKWRQTAIHAFKASTPEINTTFCILAVGRVHISQCVSECFSHRGAQEERGERRKRQSEVGKESEQQLAQASTPVPLGCVCVVSLCL